jgi:hypothetical protein
MRDETSAEVSMKKDGRIAREAVHTRFHGFRILFNGELL